MNSTFDENNRCVFAVDRSMNSLLNKYFLSTKNSIDLVHNQMRR